MGDKKINKVVFLEIKSANSKLNAQEKKLKEAIEKKKVKWEEFRIDDITNLNFEENKEFDKEIQIKLDSIKEDIREDIEEIEGSEDSDEWECDKCGEKFYLLQEEQDEFESKGKVKVKCPHCKAIITCENE